MIQIRKLTCRKLPRATLFRKDLRVWGGTYCVLDCHINSYLFIKIIRSFETIFMTKVTRSINLGVTSQNSSLLVLSATLDKAY